MLEIGNPKRLPKLTTDAKGCDRVHNKSLSPGINNYTTKLKGLVTYSKANIKFHQTLMTWTEMSFLFAKQLRKT